MRTPRSAGWVAAALAVAIALPMAPSSALGQQVGPAAVTYRSYLYTSDDAFRCRLLAARVSDSPSADRLTTVSATALSACRAIAALRVGGLSLNDDYNPTIARLGSGARVSIDAPVTLFAPYAYTYDPDTAWPSHLGWPVRSQSLQNFGFERMRQGLPSCTAYISGGTLRLSPYTSHCSAYAAWVAAQVYGINIYPTAMGDWCHAAAEQRDRMMADQANWAKVSAVDAQRAANSGSLVLAALKKSDPSKPAHEQNGHIAVVLPNVAAVARQLQQQPNYPTTPRVVSRDTFAALIGRYGPEMAQAGGLNFAHTVTANGFSGYYSSGRVAGVTPIDAVVDFFVYRHETRVDWLPS